MDMFEVVMESGGAPPHSKTQATNVSSESRPRFGVRQCFAALGNAKQMRGRVLPESHAF